MDNVSFHPAQFILIFKYRNLNFFFHLAGFPYRVHVPGAAGEEGAGQDGERRGAAPHGLQPQPPPRGRGPPQGRAT